MRKEGWHAVLVTGDRTVQLKVRALLSARGARAVLAGVINSRPCTEKWVHHNTEKWVEKLQSWSKILGTSASVNLIRNYTRFYESEHAYVEPFTKYNIEMERGWSNLSPFYRERDNCYFS